MDEHLKLGPPATGEIVIKVDPKRSGSAFAMGTESLAPGAAIPVHRHVNRDEVLFIYKGQGRATLNEKSITVLPGMTLFVPRQTWFGLRNTGTGLLQFTWTAAPPGIEEFFREVSRLGSSSDAAALQGVAQRHGIELHPAGDAATAAGAAAGHRRRRHRRGRRSGRGPVPPSAAAVQPVRPPSAPTPPPPQPTAAPASGQPQRGRRRRHRGRPGRPQLPAAATTTPPAPSAPSKAPPRRQPQARPRHRRGRVKEVYMDGRWVQVTGEGPVIAPGHERHQRRSEKDDDTPAGPLSVPL